jgi:hypothetical protein
LIDELELPRDTQAVPSGKSAFVDALLLEESE